MQPEPEHAMELILSDTSVLIRDPIFFYEIGDEVTIVDVISDSEIVAKVVSIKHIVLNSVGGEQTYRCYLEKIKEGKSES